MVRCGALTPALTRSLAYVHTLNKAVFNSIDVLHHAIEEQCSAHISHYLVNVHDNATVGFIFKPRRLDMRIDHFPLPHPVGANAFTTVDPTPFHSIWPFDFRVHQRKDCIFIAPIESVINVNQ